MANRYPNTPPGTVYPNATNILNQSQGLPFDCGLGVPANGGAGWAPSCIYVDVTPSAAVPVSVNTGTVSSCTFVSIANAGGENDFGTTGIKTDKIYESTTSAGTTFQNSVNANTTVNILGILTVGNPGTAAGQLGLQSPTSSKGTFGLIAANNVGNTAVQITNASHGQASVYTIPDCGASTAKILCDTGTQTLVDAVNIAVGTSTGTKIGTATSQKIGFHNVTPVVQHSTTANVTGFVAGSGTASKSDSVWAGASGSTAYTVGDIVTCLKAKGFMLA